MAQVGDEISVRVQQFSRIMRLNQITVGIVLWSSEMGQHPAGNVRPPRHSTEVVDRRQGIHVLQGLQDTEVERRGPDASA